MALAENLKAAQEAVDYLKSLNLRAANRIADRISDAGGIDNLIGSDQGMRTGNLGPAGAGVGAVRQVTSNPTTIMQLRINAAEITHRKYGNCHEQAQVALAHIYSTYPNVRPLDLMAFGNMPTYDHVWVGIGLSPTWNKAVPDGRNSDPTLKIAKYSLREWGPDAVWCDPWQSGGVAFAIADLLKGTVRNLSVQYKCDTAEKVEDGWPMSLLRVN